MLDCIRGAIRGIVCIASGPGSKLNKADIGGINGYGQDILGVVAALELRLAEAEGRADLAEAKLAGAQLQLAVGIASDARPPAGASYASALRMGKDRTMQIRTGQGPTLAIYPREDTEGCTSETTRAELKKHINPRAISAQVESVRRVGNAGVVVQTATAEAAERLKKAVPASLRVVEPKRRWPLVALRNIDGDPTFEYIVEEVASLNFKGNPEWTLEAVKASMKGVFKKSRRGSPFKETTAVFECSPRLREVLVELGTVFVD